MPKPLPNPPDFYASRVCIFTDYDLFDVPPGVTCLYASFCHQMPVGPADCRERRLKSREAYRLQKAQWLKEDPDFDNKLLELGFEFPPDLPPQTGNK